MKATHQTGLDITVKIGDVAICYDDIGECHDPLIFIHGFPFDKSSWRNQLEYFGISNRTIAY